MSRSNRQNTIGYNSLPNDINLLLITKPRLFSWVRPASWPHNDDDDRRLRRSRRGHARILPVFRRRIRLFEWEECHHRTLAVVGAILIPLQYGTTTGTRPNPAGPSPTTTTKMGVFECLPIGKAWWHSIRQKNLRYVNPITHPYFCGLLPCQEVFEE